MFKKRESVDVIDIPELHRKKLIKLPEPEKHENVKITNDGFFDLSQNTSQEPVQQSVQQAIQQEKSPETDFLGSFASIGSSNPQITPQIENKQENSEDVKDLKWRLENLEFKLEQLIERVNSISK